MQKPVVVQSRAPASYATQLIRKVDFRVRQHRTVLREKDLLGRVTTRPFYEVHARLARNNYATKLDSGALIAWKRAQTARWMRDLMHTPNEDLIRITLSAFAQP